MTVAGTSAVAIMLFGAPITAPVTRWVQRRNWGLIKWLRLPLWLEVPVAAHPARLPALFMARRLP
jgi:hypothetical protein